MFAKKPPHAPGCTQLAAHKTPVQSAIKKNMIINLENYLPYIKWEMNKMENKQKVRDDYGV